MSRRLLLIAVLVASVGLAGCRPRTAVVSGKVTYRKKAVTNGSVTLFCQDGQIVTGLLTPEGAYTIPNVPLGKVKVAVASHEAIPPAFQLKQALPPSKDAPKRTKAGSEARPAVKALRLPEKFSDPDRSGWALAVTDASHTFDLHLEP